MSRPPDEPSLSTPGLVSRLVVAAVALLTPLVALGVGLAVALSAATPGVRGGLVAALITWGVTCAAAVGVVAAFGWAVVSPARALARGAGDLVAGGDGDELPRHRRDEFGAAARAVATLREEREELRARLREGALRDPDTGLYDTRELRQRLEQEEARSRRREQPFALVLIEVDAPPGELAGVAAAMRAAVRPADVLARAGDTSFAALLPATSADDALPVVERLRGGLGARVRAVGVGSHPVAGATAEQVLRAATSALDTSRAQEATPVVYGR